MQVVREHISEAFETVLEKTERIDLYGRPKDAVLEMIKGFSGAGSP